MKFHQSEPRRGKGPKKVEIKDCIPGQIYEFIANGETSQEYPDVDELRICVDKLLAGRSKRMINLASGHQTSEEGAGNCKVYIHRPDIRLCYEY